MKRAILLLAVLVMLLGACDLSDLPFMPEDPNAPCWFQWATRSLPGDAQAVQEALAAAGIGAREVWASGFGEVCVTSRGTVKGFGVQAETIAVTLDVTDLADRAALGDQLGLVITTIDSVPSLASNTSVHITFQSPDATADCAMDLRKVAQAYREGTQGERLFTQFWTCPLP